MRDCYWYHNEDHVVDKQVHTSKRYVCRLSHSSKSLLYSQSQRWPRIFCYCINWQTIDKIFSFFQIRSHKAVVSNNHFIRIPTKACFSNSTKRRCCNTKTVSPSTQTTIVNFYCFLNGINIFCYSNCDFSPRFSFKDRNISLYLCFTRWVTFRKHHPKFCLNLNIAFHFIIFTHKKNALFKFVVLKRTTFSLLLCF